MNESLEIGTILKDGAGHIYEVIKIRNRDGTFTGHQSIPDEYLCRKESDGTGSWIWEETIIEMMENKQLIIVGSE